VWHCARAGVKKDAYDPRRLWPAGAFSMSWNATWYEYPGQICVNTIQGYEAIYIIHKGRALRLKKGDVADQIQFTNHTLGLTA
jgi:hypothetical protein